MVETEKEQLRRRAHELWESAGRPAIDPLSFWSLAVQEQRLKSAQAAASRARKSATQG